jgi:formylglycine-generating enzyme required for sulfatase activity
MTWNPGGEFSMGSQEDRMTEAKPWRRVHVNGYWMDKTEVTNEQFAEFVNATGYITVAERKPRTP